MIQIKQLYKSYESQQLYTDLNISFEENVITGLIGPSGCGKTTLLKIIGGLEGYERGEIIGLKNKRLSYIFQEDRLIPWISVYENVRLVLKSYMEEQAIQLKVKTVLQKLKLWEHRDYLPEKLSGGMQRRVAIARAFAYDCDILLMDEPFKGLDEALKREVIDFFLSLYEKEPKTVIWVTHDEEEIKRLAHAIYRLKGKTINSNSYKVK